MNPYLNIQVSYVEAKLLRFGHIFFKVIDRESPTIGVWVLDWVIHNRIINEISSIAREVDQGASSRL